MFFITYYVIWNYMLLFFLMESDQIIRRPGTHYGAVIFGVFFTNGMIKEFREEAHFYLAGKK